MMLVSESRHYQYYKISKGVFAAIARDEGGAFANSGIIDLGDITLIFDTAMTPTAANDLVATARRLTNRHHIDYVINSHYHRDHVRGNMVFSAETVIISNRETRRLLSSKGRDQLRNDIEQIPGRLHELERRYAREFQIFELCERADILRLLGWHRAALETLSRQKIRLPDITFDRRMAINGDKRRAVLIAVDRAHTASDTILYLPEENIAFVGDLVAHQRHFWVGELEATALEEALNFIESMQLETIVPAHGEILHHVPSDIMLNYQQHLFQMTQNATQQGVPKEEFIKSPCPEPFTHWQMKLILYKLNLEALYNACVPSKVDVPDTLAETSTTTEVDES